MVSSAEVARVVALLLPERFEAVDGGVPGGVFPVDSSS